MDQNLNQERVKEARLILRDGLEKSIDRILAEGYSDDEMFEALGEHFLEAVASRLAVIENFRAHDWKDRAEIEHAFFKDLVTRKERILNNMEGNK